MNEGVKNWSVDSSEEDEEGEEVVKLAEEDISESIKLCANSLIGRIFADRAFSVGTMESAMKAIWLKPVGFRVAELKVGRKLAGRIGGVMEVDLFEVQGKDNRIMKARIEMKASKKVRDTLRLENPNRNQIEVGLRYERIGVVYLYCATIGHDSRNCQILLEDSQQNKVRQEVIGDWVKADQVGKRLYNERFNQAGKDSSRSQTFSQPEKKPVPEWLTKGFDKLNLKEKIGRDEGEKKKQTT
ncbi:hypothetical protein PIB30_035867 [Stylosanthes scabra]|uniref:Zinc knuckle CX2CX4HX4C domain-containing protein n=1 Tax=Stylosanthes scabra TaxID=79078 RepID=A0ABU6SD27_9FABA|nr:hypothetical protein [Stylosanthes scabra]